MTRARPGGGQHRLVRWRPGTAARAARVVPEARRILASYGVFPMLARELRFWLSNQRGAALNSLEDRRDALRLKARLESELRR